MGLLRKKRNTILDVIRCDESDYLVWKWHPVTNDAVRANAIRWGSALHVKDNCVAVFAYRQSDGTQYDFIEGPIDTILETSNLPILSSMLGMLYGGDTPFQAEVYFINLAKNIQTNFAVPFFEVFDPRFVDFGVPVAVRGRISFSITDYREFIQIYSLKSIRTEDFTQLVKSAVTKYIKDIIANAPSENHIPVIQLERMIEPLSDEAEKKVRNRLLNDFGVTVSALDINTIEIDKTSKGYQTLMQVTKDVVSATTHAQADAAVKSIFDKQRIEAADYEENLRIKREEAQYAQRKQTQSANFAAYQLEQQTTIGVAGAEALGKMGNAGGTEMSGGSGFNPVGLVTGMAIGGAISHNLTDAINGMVGASTSNDIHQGQVTPPPIPESSYHIVLEGQAKGPFPVSVIRTMIANGVVTENSLVWKAGKSTWEKAIDQVDLSECFSSTSYDIPPIPNSEQ